MKSVIRIALCCTLGVLLVTLSAHGASPSDVVQPKASWTCDDHSSVTILERKGEWFKGRFERLPDGIVREMTGTVQDDHISWRSADQQVLAGHKSGDCYGTFAGDKLYLNTYNSNGEMHHIFTLVDSSGSVAAAAPSAAAPASLNQLLTSHVWKFGDGKELRFRPDGTVTAEGYGGGLTWKLDEAAHKLHMDEIGEAPQMSAHYDLWFYGDLTRFVWYESRFQNRGTGACADALAAPPSANLAPAPPLVSLPTEPMPSVRVRQFLDKSLDAILAPLDANGLDHPDPITELKDSLADDASKTIPARQPAFQAAIQVCNVLAADWNERQMAIANLQGLQSSRSSSSLGVVSDARRLTRKQLHSENRAYEQSANTTDSFANSQKTAWQQRATLLRQNVQNLYSRERDIERQVGVAERANAIEAARLEAVRRYPDLATKGSAFNVAYVARYNLYQRQQPAYFQDLSWPIRLADEIAQTRSPK